MRATKTKPAPQIHIDVHTMGVPLSLAQSMFETSRRRIVRWMAEGDLGTPRDYVQVKGQAELWITPVGLRNLAALLGREVIVTSGGGQ
jgi:hypothetical protein